MNPDLCHMASGRVHWKLSAEDQRRMLLRLFPPSKEGRLQDAKQVLA